MSDGRAPRFIRHMLRTRSSATRGMPDSGVRRAYPPRTKRSITDTSHRGFTFHCGFFGRATCRDLLQHAGLHTEMTQIFLQAPRRRTPGHQIKASPYRQPCTDAHHNRSTNPGSWARLNQRSNDKSVGHRVAIHDASGKFGNAPLPTKWKRALKSRHPDHETSHRPIPVLRAMS